MQAKKQTTKRLVESALLLSVATVLGELALVKLPYGGSVTLASLFPLLLISYRYGVKWGLGCGLSYGVISQLLGLSNLSYFTTWQSVVAVIVLDYLLAFTVMAVGGVFRPVMGQNKAFAASALLGSLLRYACHVVSGATVWAGLSIPTNAALGYSFIYNATYMVPETIVLVAVSWYLGSCLDFRGSDIRRTASLAQKGKSGGVLTALAWLSLLSGFLFDVITVFARLQDGETGEFSVAGLQVTRFAGSYLMGMVMVSAAALLLAAVLLIIRHKLLKTRPI